MPALDDAVAQLYQAPLSQFTSMRNALVKQLPAHAAALKPLAKPMAAAWAVNQLYWRRRAILDRLITAAERLRRAHLARLNGKPADTDTAEGAHRAALEAAVREATALLSTAGDPASPATAQAVSETLQTLPWTVLDGRLTKPLKPTGLEALSGMLASADVSASERPPAELKKFPSRKGPRNPGHHDDAEAAASQAADARRREVAELKASLRTAASSERAATEACTRAQIRVDDATALRDRLDSELARATKDLTTSRDALRAAEAALDAATKARERVEADLRARGALDT